MGDYLSSWLYVTSFFYFKFDLQSFKAYFLQVFMVHVILEALKIVRIVYYIVVYRLYITPLQIKFVCN